MLNVPLTCNVPERPPRILVVPSAFVTRVASAVPPISVPPYILKVVPFGTATVVP